MHDDRVSDFFCALAHATPTHYPLTVQNCGTTQTFEQAPARSVTIGQAATEMLYALGVGNTVVGTSLWFNSVLPQFKAQNDRIERLADNEPSFEAVIAKRPQLVTCKLEKLHPTQLTVGMAEVATKRDAWTKLKRKERAAALDKQMLCVTAI